MKIHVKIFGEGGTRIKIPMQMYRLRDFHMQSIATIMQMYGLSEVTLSITTMNFLPAVAVGIKTYMDDKLPPILRNEQPEIVRALKIMLERAGFTSVSIVPTPEETEKIVQYWTYIETGAPTPGDVPVNGPLPQTKDPTHTPVRMKVKGVENLPGGLGRIIASTRKAVGDAKR